MPKRTRTVLLVAALAVLIVALVLGGLHLRQPRPLAEDLAAVAPPPPPAAAPAAAKPAPSTPAAPGALTEEQFIEISARVLLGVAAIQDRPDAKSLIPPLMEKVLRDAKVSEDDFEAFAQRIYADPERSKQVGDAILERVEKKTTPQMRVRVASLAEAMKQAQAAKKTKPVEPLPPR